MKKSVLLLLLVLMTLSINAQTNGIQNKKLYVETFGGDRLSRLKIHSVDTCAFIKNTFYDDKTMTYDHDNKSHTPYYFIAKFYDGYNYFFCDRCMTDVLISEFKRRVQEYKTRNKN